MLKNILKVSKLEVKRSTIAYDRRVLLIFIPTLVIILLFFFLFLKGGNLFTNRFYTISADDSVLDPIIYSNPKFEMRGDLNTDIWVKTTTGVLVRAGYTLRSRAAAESLIKSIKEYNKNVYSYYPQDVAYPIWIKTVYLERENLYGSGSNIFGNFTDEPIIPEVETVGNQSAAAVGSGTIQGASTGSSKVVKDIELDSTGFAAAGDDNRTDVEENEDGYVTPAKMSPALPFEPVYMALTIVVVLTFISLLYSNRVYDEKVNKKGSLLMIAPLSTWEIIIGKTLPHALIAVAVSMFVALLKTQDIVSLLLIFVMVSAITLVYFSIAFVVALLSRSFKELSFLGIFYISIYSLFLLIPAFLIGYSEASYASPLTVIVKLLLGEPVGLDLLAFTLIPELLLGLLMFCIGSLIFTSEDLFSYKSIISKIIDAHVNFIKKPYYMLYSAAASVPFVFILETMLVVLLISIRSEHSLVIVLVFAAFIEETFKSIGMYTIYSRRMFDVDFRRAILLGIYTGAGFFVAEKLMLVIVIAAFVPEFSLVALAGLLIPLLLHVTFSTALSLGMYKLGARRLYPLLFVISLIHFAVNYYLSSLITGGVL